MAALTRPPVETTLYIVTAVLTVVWSVWTYLWWEEKAGLSEETAFRFLLIVAPSSYFLLVVISGWYTVPTLRLDLATLVLLDATTVLCSGFLAVLGNVGRINHRRLYIDVLVAYNLVSIILVGAVYLVRYSPVLTARLSAIASQMTRIDFFSFAWVGAQTGQPDLLGILNKLFIALLSYIPVSVIRFTGQVRRRRRMERDIESLKSKVDALERMLAEHREGVAK